MKTPFVAISFLLFEASFAQETKITKTIDDNGKTLKVKIAGEAYGRTFKESTAFDVRGMTAAQKDSLINKVIHSLEMGALREANKRYKISKNVNDDGQIMEVRIAGQAYGRDVEFMKRFEVAGLARPQKDSIVNYLMDSLQVSYRPIIVKKPVVAQKKTKK